MTTCLIVDDSAIVRKVATQMAKDIGLDCRVAFDGAEALAACDITMPDVMLLDWNMPVMDGLACVRALRARAGGPAVKVIFCTTQNEIDQVAEALAAGADEYLMKPFDRETLKGKLRQIGVL
ncbi:MAG: response regulator [Micavibrio sp.]|nr:response regulator [Micavibrio sp.]